MSTTTSTETKRVNATVAKVRHGNIHASIWRNVDHQGRVWYSTTIERTYKHKDGVWKVTRSYGRDELLVLAEVVRKAYDRVVGLQAIDREKRKQAEAELAEQN